MDIKGMHYDYKKKLNKVDSQQYRNFRIPEIDWVLNEAVEVFVKLIAKPRISNHLGFERTQRTIDDIRTIVQEEDEANPITGVNNNFQLPSDYWHYISSSVLMQKQGCSDKKAKVFIRQQDDEFETSPFDKSSFEWRTVNGIIVQEKIKLFDDDTFINKELYLGYIKRPNYIHNAEDFNANGYNLPDGTVLTGSVNCELPDHTHREIVDIAVLITTGELENQLGYQFKKEKFNLNNNN